MTIQLSERIMNIIEKQRTHSANDSYVNQTPYEDVLGQTLEFIRQILEPDSGRYDMLYRYEHSLRVAAIGKQIAKEESLPEVPLVIACLLHDAGYPECTGMEDLDWHPAISAEIAKLYLAKINYDKAMADNICRAIQIHDVVENIPTDATPFELSVRDADDIDRSDIMRMCIWGYHDIGENSAEDVIKICHKRLELIEGSRDRICGTRTAKQLWLKRMEHHYNFYRGLLEQMQHTTDILDIISP